MSELGRSDKRGSSGSRQKAKRIERALTYEEVYCCPACGSGRMSAIALMDAFSCDFCHHIFTANLTTQSVHLADSLQPTAWYWNGLQWRTASQRDTVAYLVWGFAGGLAIIPVGLIALSNYVFPPLEDSNFPLMWTGLTLINHGIISLWLLAEYHRWPWYVSSKIRLRRFWTRCFEVMGLVGD